MGDFLADALAGALLVVVYGPVLVVGYLLKYTALGLWTLGRLIVALALALPTVQRWQVDRRTNRAIAAINDLAQIASRDMDRLARSAGRR
ncbi:MAG: hypothetical protein QOH56_393 [Pseudonocardiales bacterium]|jgi:hypothetical protein|nr:hypothetical protein [Pseudonocardiales bacterium]